jgi:ribosome-associated protein
MIQITKNIRLSEDEIQWQFIRSSGPGGQNVNKLATAAQLRFNIKTTSSLSEAVKMRLMAIVGNRINAEGELIITGRRFRYQKQNRDDALARLVHFIRLAATPPKPRKKTKMPRAAKEKRLTNKRHRSERKRLRRSAEYQ